MPTLKQATKVCRKLSHQYGILQPPEVIPLKYSHVGKCVVLGFFDHINNRLEVNRYCFDLWNMEQIKETIQHELVHAACYQKYGKDYDGAHDKRFKDMCRSFGITGNVALARKRPNYTPTLLTTTFPT